MASARSKVGFPVNIRESAGSRALSELYNRIFGRGRRMAPDDPPGAPPDQIRQRSGACDIGFIAGRMARDQRSLLQRLRGIGPKKKTPRACERRAQISASHIAFTAVAAGP